LIIRAWKLTHRYVSFIYRRYGFLQWAFLPLSVLAGVVWWMELMCKNEDQQWLRSSFPLWIESGTIYGHFTEHSFLRLITSAKLAQGINFVLIVASFALIFVASAMVWNKSSSTRRIMLFIVAALIAGVGISSVLSTRTCFHEWYFIFWFSPIDTMFQNEIGLVILAVVSNTAMGLLVVAAATFHQDRSFVTDKKERLDLLSAELTDIRKLLYFASAQLTVDTYAIYSALYINVAAVNEQNRELLLDLVLNLTLIFSGAYSLVLFAAFYPSFSRLKLRAYKLARELAPDLTPKEFFTRSGFELTTLADLKDFLTILGPILASTSASILHTL